MKTKINLKHFPLPIFVSFFMLLCIISNTSAQKSAVTKKDSVTFSFKGKEQTWTVPEGVTMIHVDAYGAQGGSAQGGKGGRVQSDLKVTPGTKLIIYVGSQPSSNEGGYNGGGAGCGNGYGGGGATDIRIGGSGLENRILVAGGGGGFGYGGVAGNGGGLIGGDGKYDDNDKDQYHVAKGGRQDAGGKGARAYLSKGGEAGTGGAGVSNNGDCTNNAMAGGGGGYFGGGAGGAGGGGGGSSYTNTNNTNVKHEQGVEEGNGEITITWERTVN